MVANNPVWKTRCWRSWVVNHCEKVALKEMCMSVSQLAGFLVMHVFGRSNSWSHVNTQTLAEHNSDQPAMECCQKNDDIKMNVPENKTHKPPTQLGFFVNVSTNRRTNIDQKLVQQDQEQEQDRDGSPCGRYVPGLWRHSPRMHGFERGALQSRPDTVTNTLNKLYPQCWRLDGTVNERGDRSLLPSVSFSFPARRLGGVGRKFAFDVGPVSRQPTRKLLHNLWSRHLCWFSPLFGLFARPSPHPGPGCPPPNAFSPLGELLLGTLAEGPW